MKTIFTILLSLGLMLPALALDFVNGSYYVKSATEGMTFDWVGPITPAKYALVVGKSYASEKEMFELVTKENQTATFQFSSGLLVQVLPESEFRVDSFSVMIDDAKTEPKVLEAGDFLLNTALMAGAVNVVAPKYTSPQTACVLQTPLMNLELNNGKYHIKASQNYVFVYVLEGTLTVLDNQTNEKIIKQAGNQVLIFPSPINKNETMVTEKNIRAEEYKLYSSDVKELESAEPNVLFAIVDGKIVGIKL